MNRRFAHVLVVLLTGFLCVASIARAQLTTEVTREFPEADTTALGLLQAGLAAKHAAAEPFALDVIEGLLSAGRFDEALPAIRHVVGTSAPAQVTRLLGIIGRHASREGSAKNEGPNLLQAVEPARTSLQSLPAEEAAARVSAFFAIDDALGGSATKPRAIRGGDLILAYPGTEAALLEQVSVITREDRALAEWRLAALGSFVDRHPGTTASAKALFQMAFLLSHNAFALGLEQHGADPSPRFQRVIGLVDRLESGQYPPCEWVDRAPELVSGFSLGLEPDFQPGSIELILDGYRRFVQRHLDRSEDGVVTPSIHYIITSRMRDLHEALGNGLRGLDGTLDALEGAAADPRIVRLFRAQFYARLALSWSPEERAFAETRVNGRLRALIADNDGYWSRRALADLASLEFRRREYSRAISRFEEYLTRYPDSPWAWVATLRIGQAYAAQGASAKAATVFEHAAATYVDVPPARVMGYAFASRAYDAIGRFADALEASRHAAAAWDPDYGPEHSLPQMSLVNASTTRPAVTGTVVSRDAVEARVAQLERTRRLPGGSELERGRWLFVQRRYDAARAALVAYAERYPTSPAAAEAMSIARRATFERALEWGSAEAPTRDVAIAIALLDELVADGSDFICKAARLAKSALLVVEGDYDAAADEATRALTDLLAAQRAREVRPQASPIEADVVAIRDLLFRPLGDMATDEAHWNAFSFPTVLPAYAVVSADVQVMMPGGEMTTHTIVQRFEAMDTVVSLTADEIATVGRLIAVIGGGRTRQPTGVMEVPHQPVGDSAAIARHWSQFFPTRPGHWGGWVVATYPIIGRIEFLDAERTCATAAIAIGYSGATVIVEKVDGVWTVVRLTDRWIT